MRSDTPGTTSPYTYLAPSGRGSGLTTKTSVRPAGMGPPMIYGLPATIPVVHTAPNGVAAAKPGGSGSVAKTQTFLRGKGYNITVDGIAGVQTKAAQAAYNQGISAKVWNSRSVHAAGNSPVARSAGIRAPSAASVVNKSAGRYPSNRGPASTVPISAAPAGTPPTSGGLTPEEIATASVMNEYGPQVAALSRQMAMAQSAGQNTVANLGRLYGQVGQTAQAIQAQNLSANQGLLAGQDTANQNMEQLFGGPQANGPAGEAAAFAGINRTQLADLSSAQNAFDANMVPIIGTQGAEAQGNAAQQANAQIAALAAQMGDIQGRQGSAYTTALNTAQQQQIQNDRAQQAMDLATSLAPAKIAKAQADARLAQTNARLAVPRYNLSVDKLNATAADRATQNAFRTAEIYGVGPDGRITLAGRKAMAADVSRKAPKASQLAAWDKVASQAYKGSSGQSHYDTASGTWVTNPATVKPRQNYYPTLKHLIGMGASLEQAQKIMNGYWQKGQSGRPWVSLQGRTALERANMPLAHPMDVPSHDQWAFLVKNNLWGD